MNDTPIKSILHCPVCGHASPPDGDWRVRPARGHERLDCPNCCKTITVRGVTGLTA
jgi:predicted RNA-binding Zn-ribbon protein involved in translation (DUF1610 family)